VARKSSDNDRLLVDRGKLARLCAKSEGTVRLWLRQGIIERCNPAAPPGEKALFDLNVCLPRILSYVAEKRELTKEERAYTAARLRVMETRARQAELEYAEASGRLHSTESVLSIVGPQHVAARRRQRVKGNGVGREG
jgi:hypothetical protein